MRVWACASGRGVGSALRHKAAARDIQMWDRALRGELDGARALAGVTRRLCYVVVGRFCVAFCSIYVALVFSISFKDYGVLAADRTATGTGGLRLGLGVPGYWAGSL